MKGEEKDEFLRQYYVRRCLSGCGPLMIDIKEIMPTRTQTNCGKAKT